jgi:hypothetical protein
MELSTRTRRTISTVLAVFLAVEAVSAVAATAASTTVSHPLPAEAPAGRVLAAEATVAPALPAVSPRFSAPAYAPRIVEPAEAPAGVIVSAIETVKVTKASKPTKVAKSTKSTKATTSTKAPAKTSSKTGAKAPAYSGTNHVWIPELGINKAVRAFPCDRQRPPDNYMYRWGCAGANNVYLMGHASSVMEGLHDAYVSGRLHKGMKAYYAGGNGRVHVYTVRWWKKTLPTTDAAWAWASQDVPSMTLQTCVGRNSEYRLMVRLVEVDG